MSGLRLRVLKDGTRPDRRLCDSCERGFIAKGPQQGQEIVVCYAVQEGTRLRFPVVECSGYTPKGQMSDWTAKQIGWVLEVKAGKVLGFKPPKKEYGPEF